MQFSAAATGGFAVAAGAEGARASSRSTALHSITCAVGLALATSACSESPQLPGAPSAAVRAAPSVSEVVPDVGSTAGGATVKIVGTGFMPGMVVTFDDIKVAGRSDTRDTLSFYTESPPHQLGIVDLVVSNPDGQSQRRTAAYRYAAPDAFDMNGAWSGFSTNGTDTLVSFVIQANRLVSASCAFDVLMAFTFTAFPSTIGGEFSLTAAGGQAITGRIVSASEIVGTFSLPPCTSTVLPFRATRTS